MLLFFYIFQGFYFLTFLSLTLYILIEIEPDVLHLSGEIWKDSSRFVVFRWVPSLLSKVTRGLKQQKWRGLNIPPTVSPLQINSTLICFIC